MPTLVRLAAFLTALVCSCTATPVDKATVCHSSVLASPTAVYPFKGDTTETISAVGYTTITLPFEVGIKGHRSNLTEIDFGGVVTNAHTDYYADWYIYFVPDGAIHKGKNQGIWYDIEGKAPNRTANIEWRLGSSKPKYKNFTWHFGLQWYENNPGLSRLKFWNIPVPERKNPNYWPFVEYYRNYYFKGPTSHIKSGEVLQFRNYEGGPDATRFYRGPNNACQYKPGEPEFDDRFWMTE